MSRHALPLSQVPLRSRTGTTWRSDFGRCSTQSRGRSASRRRAIVVRDGSGNGLEIVASYGLDAAATAGLAEAMQRPTHPVTMTFEATAPTYDVAPMNPGGPRLRSHLPLIVTRGRTPRVLGVLALAHDDEIAPEAKPIIGAAADLAAARIERQLSGQLIGSASARPTLTPALIDDYLAGRCRHGREQA